MQHVIVECLEATGDFSIVSLLSVIRLPEPTGIQTEEWFPKEMRQFRTQKKTPLKTASRIEIFE